MSILWVVVDAVGAVLRSGTAPDKASAVRVLAPSPEEYVTSLASYQAGQRERIRPVAPSSRVCSKCKERDAKPERSWCQRCENVKRWETEQAKRQAGTRARRARHLHTPDVKRKSLQATIQRGIQARAAKRQQRGEG